MMANTIPCFITQDYPADRRELIILDDAGELKNETGERWQIISIPRRFRSLPEKFNALAGLARGEILVVWEDDGLYMQRQISTHVRSMEGRMWAKPSSVLSTYTGSTGWRMPQADSMRAWSFGGKYLTVWELGC